MDVYKGFLPSRKRCMEESNEILFQKAIEWVIKTGLRSQSKGIVNLKILGAQIRKKFIGLQHLGLLFANTYLEHV